ncbi:MAG TPA: aminotransferase class V-fold PLP-dependent enzyme [Gemmataceae bacterium]|nr:aminotransferase class V-fold PLP-dependent enzyme [Gemmataceae bacterium]
MHPDLLYLDTARVGRMSRSAQAAHLDYARLATDEGGSLFFERFLRQGVDSSPAKIHEFYPGLATWRGIGQLKHSLRALASGRRDLPVLLANRCAALMRFASRLLFHPCRNVLVTDLGWPAYHSILEAEAQRASRSVTTVHICQAILSRHLTEDELIQRLRNEFLDQGCDGLFLSAVSNLGVRLPVERIVRAIEATSEVRLIVIDGAQDFCHASSDLRNEYSDLYLAGSHKWLKAHHPMGVAFYGKRRSSSFIETGLDHLLATGELDDPLLRFSRQLETCSLDGTSETVSLASLFSCQGAANDILSDIEYSAHGLAQLVNTSDAAADVARVSGWYPLRPEASFRSGILLLEAEKAATKLASAEALRSGFYEKGIALTAYDNGIIRLSVPEHGWKPGDLDRLGGALQSIF